VDAVMIGLPDALPGLIPDSEMIRPAAPEVIDEWPPLFRDLPLTEMEKKVYGEDAARCPETGFVWEAGTGANSRRQQTAQFKANLCNREWVLHYLRTDPQAGVRHPKLLEYYRSQL
jgi:hypothetical protein